ncbi:MAG: methylated-DNA--[protein]-cysteine S-methyltransferase [Micrococcales bacterium]|nr:methylated-DNA--[protein]-cysteine S-methyltransferase [Micrococcales bacterium]
MHTVIASPIGPLTLAADADGTLTGLYFEGHRPAPRPGRLGEAGPAEVFTLVTAQLEEYFAGRRRSFDLPYRTDGTPFQQEVWEALSETEHGTTTTYAALAAMIGRPTAVRAVGAAVGRNPVSIVVPCHRVVGASGLTGYAGGLDRKRHLLDLERPDATPPDNLF